MTGWITVRGDEYEVEYRYFGYDPDTGATELDWDFTGRNPPGNDLTDAEVEAIEIELIKRSEQDFGCD